MQQDEHGAWLLTSPCFFLEFVGISLYWRGGFPSSFWNRVVTRIMLKNLQRLICEDRAVASRHAEVLQSPNSLEIFQGKSRGW